MYLFTYVIYLILTTTLCDGFFNDSHSAHEETKVYQGRGYAVVSDST